MRSSAGRPCQAAPWQGVSATSIMNIFPSRDIVEINDGVVLSSFKILEYKNIGGVFIVIYDYMDFPKNSPSRNLYAYDSFGRKLWRAKDIGAGATDSYVNLLSEKPLKVGNFAGYSVTIDIENGAVVTTEFTK